MKGIISIFKDTEDNVRIRLEDTISGILFLEVTLSMVDFNLMEKEVPR